MINAHMLNSLLLRKDICHWTKGIQIRYVPYKRTYAHSLRTHECVRAGIVKGIV